MRAAKVQRKQPVQSRSIQTCEAIVEATIQVLLREGSARTTTTRVAERAGVSVGTLYQYYPNKMALIDAVRDRYFGLMTAAAQDIVTQHPDLGLDVLVDKALSAVIAIKRQNKALSLALVELPRAPGQPDFSGEVVRHFAEFVIQHGLLSKAPTDHMRAQIIAAMAAIEGTLGYTLKHAPEWLDEPWLLAQLKAMVRSGLSELPR